MDLSIPQTLSKSEADIPPPVIAWFTEIHRNASPNGGDTELRFRIENISYVVTIHRQQIAK